MKVSIVIPVYNEIDTILEILHQVTKTPIEKEIIIIDDCSTDGTREALKEIKEGNIQLILNNKNRGKGFCVRRGFECVNGDIVIIQDADLEYYPDEYPILIQKIRDGKADVVYGNRFLGSRRVFNFYNYPGNKLLNIIGNILYNNNMGDLMTGYKAFRADVLKRLRLRANGFGIEAEITAQIFKRRLKVYEVPISYNGKDYDEGKKITWKDFFRSVYWLIKCKFENLDIGEDTLYKVKLMKNNNRWAFEQIRPYLGNSILEVGSGIGNISNFLAYLKKDLILTDINKNYLSFLNQMFIGNPKIRIIPHDILSTDISNISPLKIDTVTCMNVLEHIKEDDKALENIYKILVRDGYLILMVPAVKNFYGPLDEKLGHFRRYNKTELVKKLESKNFTVEKIYYQNFVGGCGWFLTGRILRGKIIGTFQAVLLDTMIPLFAKIEKKVKIPCGLSLIAICKKR